MKKEKPILIIKVGSSVITDDEGNLNVSILENIVFQTVQLLKQYKIILVSSGAVSSGKKWLKKYNKHLSKRKAAAAIGNPILMKEYSAHFLKYGFQVAQALLERQHFANRFQFLQLKETIFELWQNEIIPIVNENDVVSNYELQFSDNDELATLLAISFNADVLLFCTSAGGYKDGHGAIIPVVEDIDGVIRFLRDDKSTHGTGGMSSKLTFTKLATGLGIRVVYCGIRDEHSFIEALKGKHGTTFTARSSTLNERQKWLASGSITIGSIEIDEGAYKALQQRKSLLLVGVTKIIGAFSAGEVVQLALPGGEIAGVAKMRFSASELTTKRKNIMVAHADNIVVF
jgi:glutamate 5-kinase